LSINETSTLPGVIPAQKTNLNLPLCDVEHDRTAMNAALLSTTDEK
jgi:hypothetical protein